MTDEEFENLSDTGIRKLRVIAKDMGVKAPTRLSKSELLEEIKKVYNKEVEPYFSTIKVGRPKKKVTTDDYLAAIKANQAKFNQKPNDTLTFSDSVILSVFDDMRQFSNNVGGYFRPDNPDFGYIDIINHSSICSVMIAGSLIKRYSLLTGDYVNIKYSFLSGANQNIVNEVTAINNQRPLVKERVNYQDMPCRFPDRKINIELKKPITFGSRNIIVPGENRYLTLKELSKKLANCNQFDIIYYFAVNESPEIKSLFQKLSVPFPVTSSYTDNLQEIKLLINNVKRNLELNHSIMFVVTSLKNLKKFLYGSFNALGFNEDQTNLQVSYFINEIFNLSRDTESNASITVIVCNDDNDNTYNYMANTIIE